MIDIAYTMLKIFEVNELIPELGLGIIGVTSFHYICMTNLSHVYGVSDTLPIKASEKVPIKGFL